VRGNISADASDVATFKGIPYSKPPIGPLRWQAPVSRGGWHETLDACSFGSICWQQPSVTADPAAMSEDCL
jgi:para-nitrobenzyl esterase